MHPQTALQAFLLAFPALFSIVNPLAGGLIFRTATAERTHPQRIELAGRVGIYAFLVMATTLWAGSFVLAFFGITLAALRIAGGLIVSLSAWALLNAPEHREARKQEQASSAEGAEDVAFFPLTMPFTTGPGTISVAVALGSEHPSWGGGELLFFLGVTTAAAAGGGNGLDRLPLRRFAIGAARRLRSAHPDPDRCLPAALHRRADPGQRCHGTCCSR